TPARTAFESTSPSMGCFTETEVIVRKRPHRRSCMIGSAHLAKQTVDSRLRSEAETQSSSVVSANDFVGGPPALATQISSRPKCAAVSATKWRTSSCTVTSKARVRISAPVSRRISSAAASSVDSVRAHIASFAPSLANPRATALPSPWLDAATIATRSLSPRSIGLAPAKVRVVFLKPVVADRAEDVEIERVFERDGAVRHVRRDAQDLARAHDHLLAFQLELQRALKDVSDLLAFVEMLRDDRALLEKHLRDHRLIARDDFTADALAHHL